MGYLSVSRQQIKQNNMQLLNEFNNTSDSGGDDFLEPQFKPTVMTRNVVIKKKEKLLDALKMVANRVNTGGKVYYFMPFYFSEHGEFNLSVHSLENPPQDLIDYLNNRREGEGKQPIDIQENKQQ